MTDIVERLRAPWGGYNVAEEAAAEIERLQSCLYAQENVPALYKEIKRLRAALTAIANRERPSTARSMARRALEPKQILPPD